MRERPGRGLAGFVVMVAMASACGGVSRLSFPVPSPTVPPGPTTTAPDLTGIPVRAVPGQSAGPVAIGPGQATISGKVIGPTGPVAGATVEADRFVGGALGRAEVTSDVAGKWSMPGVLGGRYRVRAWRSPDMDLLTPQIFFLNSGVNKVLILLLQPFSATSVNAAVAPDPPVVNQAADLVVQLTVQTVDAAGIVRANPLVGATVMLSSSAGYAIGNANGPEVTGIDGEAAWSIVCLTPGPQPLAVTVNSAGSYPIALAPCANPPPVTTTSSTTSTTAVIPTTTTSTP